MSVAKVDDNRKVTTHRLIEMKQRGEKISMLTAYNGWKRDHFADYARPDDLPW